jgi:hypothetical protein
MQTFIAELSNIVDHSEFERSWLVDSAKRLAFKVDFGFSGRRVSIRVHSNLPGEWRSNDLHQAFAEAIRRVDRNCNVRWL